MEKTEVTGQSTGSVTRFNVYTSCPDENEKTTKP
jgi:hypothetical protein